MVTDAVCALVPSVREEVINGTLWIVLEGHGGKINMSPEGAARLSFLLEKYRGRLEKAQLLAAD